MGTILEVKGLGKKFPSFELKDVSFSLTPGRISGFIGRNGAGKTTTLKCIYNLVKPTSGEILYKGQPLTAIEAQAKNEIGLLFGGIDYYPTQKVRVIAEVTSRFYHKWDQALFGKWLHYFNIDPEKRVKDLSNGMKVKFGLAMALSHGAEALLLDEPTSGLDPVSRDELLDCFMRIASQHQTAILFSTHVISDLERCADDIVYISQGQIVFSGDVPAFKSGFLHVEGDEKGLTDPLKEGIGHLLVHFGKFSGVIKKDQESSYGSFKLTEPSLEEIMLYIERGHADEESPL